MTESDLFLYSRKLTKEQVNLITKCLVKEFGLNQDTLPKDLIYSEVRYKNTKEQILNAVNPRRSYDLFKDSIQKRYWKVLELDSTTNYHKMGLIGIDYFNDDLQHDKELLNHYRIERWGDYMRNQTFYNALTGNQDPVFKLVVNSFDLDLNPLNLEMLLGNKDFFADHNIKTTLDLVLSKGNIDCDIEEVLEHIGFGWVDAMIYSLTFEEFMNIELNAENSKIDNPVFMALIQKYFLEGSQPLYSKTEMSRPKKAALIHFLRDRKVSAKSILSNHLGMKKLSDENQIIFDEIVAKINSTTEGNIQELFNKNKQNQATHQP